MKDAFTSETAGRSGFHGIRPRLRGMIRPVSAWFGAMIWLLAIQGGLPCAAFAEEDASSTNDLAGILPEPVPKRRPLVVLKQSTIKGRVFFLREQDGEVRDEAAEALAIEVRYSGQNEAICTVKTDKEGVFYLPNLDVGKYELRVGSLILELRVEEALEGPTYARRIPKTILIFMPTDLR